MSTAIANMEVRKRKSITIGDKVEIIREIENGLRQTEASKKFGLSSSTISTLMKNKEKYIGAVHSNINAKKQKRCELSDVDAALFQWFKVRRNLGLPIDGPIIKKQAESFAHKLGYSSFVCNNGWLDRFKNRHNIVYAKACKAEPIDANEWLANVWPTLREGFADENIYNADETGLFYDLAPNQTCRFIDRTCIDGKEASHRLTALVCANMTGSDKRRLLIVGNEPITATLPGDYVTNKKAWITCEIFQQYLINWNKALMKCGRTILLLIDNCTAHVSYSLSNIMLVLVPANATSAIQPMDLGVIRCLKGIFKRYIVLHTLEHSAEEFITVTGAINLLCDAWNKISPQTIQNCFKKLRLKTVEVVKDELDEDCDDVMVLSEWMAANNVPCFSDVEEFEHIDDHLAISGVPTDDDIIDNVRGGNEGANNHCDTRIARNDVPECEVSVMTVSEAQSALDKLSEFFQGTNASDEIFKALSVLRTNLRDSRVKFLKETNIE